MFASPNLNNICKIRWALEISKEKIAKMTFDDRIPVNITITDK